MLNLLLGIGIGGIIFTEKGKQITNDIMSKSYNSIKKQLSELNIFEDTEKKSNDEHSQNIYSYPKSIKNEKNNQNN